MKRLRAYSFGHLLKTVALVEAEIAFFGTTVQKTIDVADFRSFFMELEPVFYENSFFQSFCFSVVAGRLPRDCKEEPWFMNRKIFKDIRQNRMRYCEFLSLMICIAKS